MPFDCYCYMIEILDHLLLIEIKNFCYVNCTQLIQLTKTPEICTNSKILSVGYFGTISIIFWR